MLNDIGLGQRRLLYSGSTKKIYGADKDSLIIHYDSGNSTWRNHVSSTIWNYLSKMGIKNHFIQRLNLREQLVKSAKAYSVFVRIYNIVPASMRDRLGIEEGTCFNKPLIEWHLKSRDLGNPIISLDHVKHFGWLEKHEIKEIYSLILRTNDILQAYFYCHQCRLGDFSLEFGLIDNSIILIDEVSPETCNFWNIEVLDMINKDDAYDLMKSITKHK